MTEEQIQQEIEILAQQPLPQKRVWEVDFVRGLLIWLVTFDHFLYDCAFLFRFTSEFGLALKSFAVNYYLGYNLAGDVRAVIQYGCIMLFVFIAGLSCALSKSNFKRGVKMAGFSFAFTFVTYMLENLFGFVGMTITFNVLHVIATCTLMWSLIDLIFVKCNKTGKTILYSVVSIVSVVVIILGYHYLNNIIKTPLTPFQSIFFYNSTLFANSPGDHLNLFPALGFFMIGAMLSKVLYKERKTLFPFVNEKYLIPFTFSGKYCLFIYIGAQIFFVALGGILGWI